MNAKSHQSNLEIPPLVFKDCALVAIATNKRATTLKECRDQIDNLATDSLYYHFWANLLLPYFEELEYINDFASWVRHGLHDRKLAEQLAMLDPTLYDDFEELRYHLLEHIDDRLEESEYLQWMRASQSFEFVRSQIVVFDSQISVSDPRGLPGLIPRMSVNSLFYHFIDARRRTQGRVDDFRQWLGYFGETYQPLIDILAGIDPYFVTLTRLREQLAGTFQDYFAEQAP